MILSSIFGRQFLKDCEILSWRMQTARSKDTGDMPLSGSVFFDRPFGLLDWQVNCRFVLNCRQSSLPMMLKCAY